MTSQKLTGLQSFKWRKWKRW